MNITSENIEDRNLVLDFQSQNEAIDQWTRRHELSKYLFESALLPEIDSIHINLLGQPHFPPFSPYQFLRQG